MTKRKTQQDQEDLSKIWPYHAGMRNFTRDKIHSMKPDVLRKLLENAITALDDIEQLMREEFKALAEKGDETIQ